MSCHISPPPWYALRRTLPPHSFEDNLREMIELLPRYHVEEVIVKVDTEELSHGQPPLEWIRRYQPCLIELRDRLRDIGIDYSLNPWITLGHCDRGRNDRPKFPDMAFMVGHDGTGSTCCACPLSGAWRDHVAAVWTRYAQTRPKVIWIEDDIRTFNHEPVRFGCFCETHLARFSEQIGLCVTREELVSALLQPGEPHPWRAVWLDLQAEVMIETVAHLTRVVRATSPDTCMGLMSSGPRMHCLEGRRWDAFAEALAGGRPLISRPPMGNYSEDSLRGFYYSQDSIKITRHVLPAGCIEQAEIENVPFTRYANSVAFTFMEIAISFALGCEGVTLNLFDHVGTPMEDEPWFGRMLAEKKPFFRGLAQRAKNDGMLRGTQMVHHPRSSACKQLQAGQDYGALAEDGYAMMLALEAHGLTTTYQDEPVVATSGQVFRALSDAQMGALLGPGRGLLLDGPAAAVLVERGFGEQIGLASIAPAVNADELEQVFAAEELHHPAFGGSARRFLTATLPNLARKLILCPMVLSDKAKIISSFVDPELNRHLPAMTVFENDRGGRVAIHACDFAAVAGVAFHHPFRRTQLTAVLDWLWRGQLPLSTDGGVWPWSFRMDHEDRTLLGLFNLSLDAWERAEFRLFDPRRLGSVRRLSQGGRWTGADRLAAEQANGHWILRNEPSIAFGKPLFVDIQWE